MQLACPCTDSAASCTLALSSFRSPLCTLILHTIIQLWTCRSYETRRSYNTAHRGMHAVPLFCEISVSTWTRLHVLILLLLSCEYLHLLSACEASKPNLLSALLRSASTPLSTCSLRLGHSLLVALESLRSIFCTCRLPPVDNTQTGKRQDHNRQGRHAETHATEHAAEQQDSQQRVLNRTIQMTQCIVPVQRQI